MDDLHQKDDEGMIVLINRRWYKRKKDVPFGYLGKLSHGSHHIYQNFFWLISQHANQGLQGFVVLKPVEDGEEGQAPSRSSCGTATYFAFDFICIQQVNEDFKATYVPDGQLAQPFQQFHFIPHHGRVQPDLSVMKILPVAELAVVHWAALVSDNPMATAGMR
ncbi:hypothetical protein EYF80_017358 [Liparis tanakae]|uniref:Uncharacterized protein n=1 Tax=Liparis tanakae TaxID=230148 RepID=A0A4Z2I589_9TELE|nr:hypothetical protein EYF80_017358 [Liparis tanakae]